MLGKEVRKMNNPRLTFDEWKVFENRELIIYWEMSGTHIGRVKKVKMELEGNSIIRMIVTMAVCFEIRMVGEETVPLPKCRREDLEVTFSNPGQMRYGCDVATIICSGSRLTVTNDPDVHHVFMRISEIYETRADQGLRSPSGN
jgi:sporulation protein YlmC with PRC-barrel domain